MRRTAAALALALLLPLPSLAGEVVVKPGETLSEIAERYGTSVERLMQLNGLRSAKDLWAGSRIQVPGASPARPASAAAPLNRNARDHKVQPGETLSEIADRYGISMDRLISLNGLKEPNDLQAGSTLRLKAPTTPAARPRPSTVATKPPVKPTPKPVSTASKPAKPAKPAVAASTTATPATSAATATAIASARPVTSQVVSSNPSAAAAKPSAAVAKPAVVAAAATKPVSSASAAKPAKPSSPDWRSYGPLQVDWANWQPMGGSMVAPTLNGEGQSLYLAVNCTARKLNATSQAGQWKTWDDPQADFEQQLVNDLCKARS
jgi:LysM repeat protein